MPGRTKTVLAVCAHPDDAEFRCLGTLALLRQQGWEVHIATLSCGDCGSVEMGPEETARVRRTEAEAAAALLGGSYHALDGRDLQLFEDNATRAAVTALVRRVDPACLITHYPVDYMPDHEVTSAAARAAGFTAPIPNYRVGPAADAPPTAGIVPLYYFSPTGGGDYFGNPVVPDFYVDVTAVMDLKTAALACHDSQRAWLRRQHGIDQYLEEMRAWDAALGRAAGVPFAEGFFLHRGHPYPLTPLIQDAVGARCRPREGLAPVEREYTPGTSQPAEE